MKPFTNHNPKRRDFVRANVAKSMQASFTSGKSSNKTKHDTIWGTITNSKKGHPHTLHLETKHAPLVAVVLTCSSSPQDTYRSLVRNTHLSLEELRESIARIRGVPFRGSLRLSTQATQAHKGLQDSGKI